MGVTNEEFRYSAFEFFRFGGADEIFDLSAVADERRCQREALGLVFETPLARALVQSMSNFAGPGEAREFLPANLQGVNIGIALKYMATDHAIDCARRQAVSIKPTDHGVLAFPAHGAGHG